MRARHFISETKLKGKVIGDGIAVSAYVDGKLAGTYEYKDSRHLADVKAEYQQLGIGSLLLLKLLDIASDNKIPVYRDESETSAYQALVDSLENKQYIIVDDEEDELMISNVGYKWLKKQEQQ